MPGSPWASLASSMELIALLGKPRSNAVAGDVFLLGCCWCIGYNYIMCQGLNSLDKGMVIAPFVRSPDNGYVNPCYFVDDYPLLNENIRSLDPDRTYKLGYTIGCFVVTKIYLGDDFLVFIFFECLGYWNFCMNFHLWVSTLQNPVANEGFCFGILSSRNVDPIIYQLFHGK